MMVGWWDGGPLKKYQSFVVIALALYTSTTVLKPILKKYWERKIFFHHSKNQFYPHTHQSNGSGGALVQVTPVDTHDHRQDTGLILMFPENPMLL